MRPVAQIAQSVEQGIENPRVGGSIPSLGTTFSFDVVFTPRQSKQKTRLVRVFCCARFLSVSATSLGDCKEMRFNPLFSLQGHTLLMSSPKKQQKNAQRAKSKAKQNRIGKPAKTSASSLMDHPFDDVKIDLSTFNFQDILDNGFDPADYDDLFQVMKAAEAINLQALCTVFLQYPVLELVISEEEEEPATDFLMGLLIEYRIAIHGDDEDSAVAWIETPAFQKAYVEASRVLQERNTRSAH